MTFSEFWANNRFIKINNKTIPGSLIKSADDRDIQITNLVDRNGKFLNYNNMTSVLSNLSIIKYNSLLSAIPREWKNKIIKININIDDIAGD